MYNSILRTYAGACKIKETSKKDIEILIKDSWNVFKIV